MRQALTGLLCEQVNTGTLLPVRDVKSANNRVSFELIVFAMKMKACLYKRHDVQTLGALKKS